MTPEILEILCNREVLAVDQNKPGVQGTRVRREGDREVWMKPLHDRSLAVVLFNRGVVAAPTAEDFADLGPRANARRRVRDLWQHNDRGVVRGALTMTVPAHGVVMLRLFPARPAP